MGAILDISLNCPGGEGSKDEEIGRDYNYAKVLTNHGSSQDSGYHGFHSNTKALHWGHLCTRPLLRLLSPYQWQIMERRDVSIKVPLAVKHTLRWWTVKVTANLRQGKAFHISHPVQLFMDASLSSWGGGRNLEFHSSLGALFFQ